MNAVGGALRNPTARISGVFIIVALVAYAFAPRLASVGGFGAVLDRANIVGIVALGLTVCLIAGQIDLSIGANIALSGVVAIAAQPLVGSIGGLFVGVATGVLIGFVNAAIVVGLGLPSLIATLATMLAVRSMALVVTDGQPITGNDIQLALEVDRFVLPGVTVRTLVWIAAAVILGIFLLVTRAGRNLVAVGGDHVAARSAGIPSRRYIAGSIIASGGFGGLAGVLLAASLNTGSPVVGDPLLLTALAAAVIGGATLTGGRGSALGAVFGVLTVVLAVVAMEFTGIPAYIQQIVSGSILVAVLVLDRLTSRRR